MSDASHSHSHSHSHSQIGHEHKERRDFAAANAKHFNESVHKFEEQPFAKEFAGRQLIAYLGAYPFDGEQTVMMDFACGIGRHGFQADDPYAKQIVAVDISQGLVDEFNLRAKNQGLTPDEMKAVCIQLKGEEGELDNHCFCLRQCGMAYHHISDVARTTQTLAFFFKDVVPHTHGFKESEVRKLFEDAGLVEFQLNTMSKAKHHEFPAKVFIAKGVKPKA